jgi:hypothetical protein
MGSPAQEKRSDTEMSDFSVRIILIYNMIKHIKHKLQRREEMVKKDLMDKYRGFASDYNGGMDKSALCNKYRLPEKDFDSFLNFLKRKGFVLSVSQSSNFKSAHDIDFEIFGDDMQFVEIELDPGETAVAEAGAMMYMDSGIQMETIFGDGSEEHNSIMGKIFGAGKRVLTGESLFMTAFTNAGRGKQRVSFGAPYPGKIIPIDLSENGGEILCQKDAFLCAAKGVSIGIAFQKKIEESLSRKKSGLDFLGARDLFSRGFRVTVTHLFMQEEQ